jgi:hypothetical protein
LHERIRFLSKGRFSSLRQPQLELKPFDRERLINVATRLRELFPAGDRGRLMERISDDFIEQLVDQVTAGFKGDVGVVPRQFLREFVNQMDLVDENENYLPMQAYGFAPENLRPEEEAVVTGEVLPADDESAEEIIPHEDVW